MRKVKSVVVLTAMLSFMLVACGSEAEKPEDEQKTAQEVVQPAPKPTPQYASIDGDEYLYQQGISDEERNSGQAAAEYTAFRFKGVKDGKITLTSSDMTLTCDVNCKVITITTPYGSKDRIEYNPVSVVGSAFSDAMNGFLVENPSKANGANKK